MNKQALIKKYKNKAVLKTALHGESILHEFIAEDNIKYFVIKVKDELDVVPAATIPVPSVIPFRDSEDKIVETPLAQLQKKIDNLEKEVEKLKKK